MSIANNPEQADIVFLARFLGFKLLEISRADFLFDQTENSEHFGPIQLKFETDLVLVIEDSGDSESISFSNDELKFSNEKDPNKWHKIDLSKKDDWSKLINKKLIDFSLLIDSDFQPNKVCGCRLKFSDNQEFTYFNYYDDAKISIGNNSTFLDAFEKEESKQWLQSGST